MKRRALLWGPAVSLAAASGGLPFGASLAWAQPAPAKRRIGLLTSSTNEPFVTGIKQALREVGYEEGRNLEIVSRDGRGRADLIEQAVQDLLRADVEVIVLWATGAAQAATRATKRIPIVAQVADATEAGLVGSLARPEGNITGISSMSFHLTGKRVELLLEAVPRARAMGFVGMTGEPNMHRFYELVQRATRPGVEQRLIEVRGINDLEPAVTAARAGLDGLTLQQIFAPFSERLGAMVQRLGLPACGAHRSFAQAGGLMSVDAFVEDGLRRMARYVEQLLAGVPISRLPFEQLSRTYTVVNLRAAAALGLTLPPTLQARADELID